MKLAFVKEAEACNIRRCVSNRRGARCRLRSTQGSKAQHLYPSAQMLLNAKRARRGLLQASDVKHYDHEDKWMSFLPTSNQHYTSWVRMQNLSAHHAFGHPITIEPA